MSHFQKFFNMSIWLLISIKRTYAYYFFVAQKQTITDIILNVLKDTITNTFNFSKLVIVNVPIETVLVIISISLLILVYKLLQRGRHFTSDPKSTMCNIFNTMQLDSSGSYSKVSSENSSHVLKNQYIKTPETFKDGMDIKSWLMVMDIYLKNLDKSEWISIVVSHIENKVLRRIKDLQNFTENNSKNYDEFKKTLIDLFTVKPKDITANRDKLNDCRQTVRESIKDFGENIINMVKKIFPNVNDSTDIDKIMQERFVEGLFCQRLRETVGSKMLKMMILLELTI